jgi:hypothetical protein
VTGTNAKQLYVLDTASHTVRQIEPGTGAVRTIAGLAGASGTAAGGAAAVPFLAALVFLCALRAGRIARLKKHPD